MKSIKLVFAILIAVFTFQTSVAQNGKKNEKAVIKTTIHCDHCKVCETCGQIFDTEKLKIKGVKMYELDEQNMTITVHYNGQKTNLTAIKTAITKLGYDADEMKADTVAYDKLDGCCKK
jgi:periplasmic mercuric ion binding protein